MRFRVSFTKLGNQFSFISNLTEWHFSCEKEYNKVWLEKTGALNDKEKEALKQFRKILKRYGFKKEKDKVTWVGTPFIIFSERKAWQKVKERMGEKEDREIKKIFNLFEPRFGKIWKKEVLKLKRAKELLKRELMLKSKKIDKTLSALSKFYNQTLPKRIINVYLLAIPSKSSGIGGSAVLGEKGIILEIKDLKDLQDYILVLIHEMGHAFLEKTSIEKIKAVIAKVKFPPNELTRKRGKVGLINELILCSLVPDGYLAEKYFGIVIQKPEKIKASHKDWKSLLKFTTFYLRPLAQRYIEAKKPLDKEYVMTTIKLIKKFINNKK